MLSKIFIFFRTPHFAAYISAYIRWPVPGGPYLTTSPNESTTSPSHTNTTLTSKTATTTNTSASVLKGPDE